MFEKLLIHMIASQLTQAVMSGLQQPDPMQRQVLACQIEVNFYEWVRQTLLSADWPNPAIDPAWLVNILKSATGVVSGPTGVQAGGTLPVVPPGNVQKAMAANPWFAAIKDISPAKPKG